MKYVGLKKILLISGVLVITQQSYLKWDSLKLEKEATIMDSQNETLHINSKQMEQTMNYTSEKSISSGIVTEVLTYPKSNGTSGTIIVVDESIQALINHYCEVFNVNQQIANLIAEQYIHQDSFKSSFSIPGTTVRGKERTFPSMEAGIVAFVKALKDRPDNFGYTEEQIFYDYQYTTAKTDEDLIAYACEIFGNGIPKEIVFSIFMHESGRKTSNQYLNFNNGYGLLDTKGALQTFSNREEATINAVMNQMYRYVIDEGYQPSDPNFLALMQPIYSPIGAGNDSNNLNQYWLANVSQFYSELLKDYYAYSDVQKEQDDIQVASAK